MPAQPNMDRFYGNHWSEAMPMSYLCLFCFDGQNIRKACCVQYLHDGLTNMTQYNLTGMGLLHDEQNSKACGGDVGQLPTIHMDTFQQCAFLPTFV